MAAAVLWAFGRAFDRPSAASEQPHPKGFKGLKGLKGFKSFKSFNGLKGLRYLNRSGLKGSYSR
jgi:hypothetical protein